MIVNHYLSLISDNSEAQMIIRMIGVLGTTVIRRIAVGNAGMAVVNASCFIAIVPVASAHTAVRLAVRHKKTAIRSLWIIIGT